VIVVDANLLHDAIITGFPPHTAARSWWEGVLNGTDEVGLAMPALFGFLRISTNPRVMTVPLAIDDAVGHVES
jgi:uncharacterized protein